MYILRIFLVAILAVAAVSSQRFVGSFSGGPQARGVRLVFFPKEALQPGERQERMLKIFFIALVYAAASDALDQSVVRIFSNAFANHFFQSLSNEETDGLVKIAVKHEKEDPGYQPIEFKTLLKKEAPALYSKLEVGEKEFDDAYNKASSQDAKEFLKQAQRKYEDILVSLLRGDKEIDDVSPLSLGVHQAAVKLVEAYDKLSEEVKKEIDENASDLIKGLKQEKKAVGRDGE
ncbi:hypothetical protein AAVH_09621 [Aphelenchoides avenae]|nr:hypothetical protein AAVH_09621 [Aphelenchus avenae]